MSDAFLWLQDDGAEELLCSLLPGPAHLRNAGGELRAEAQLIDSSGAACQAPAARLRGSADEGAGIG